MILNPNHLLKGFTLLELMIVIAILWVLVTALVPWYNAYIERGRDTSRLADIDDIAKSTTLYYTEHDVYPVSTVWGCVNYVLLLNYMLDSLRYDPISDHYNGCNTLWSYGYAMSTWILTNPNVFSLLAIMEQPNAGNYGGDLDGFTGTLTAAAYNTGMTLLNKWNGRYYIRIP